MRAAALLVLGALGALGALGGARAQDEARWARVDALLPPTLRLTLPALIQMVGDFCELPSQLTSSGELYVVEHGKGGRRRYPMSSASARLRALRPARLALYAAGWGNAPGDAAARAVVAALRSEHPLVLELDTSTDVAVGYTEAAVRIGELSHGLAGLMSDAVRAGVPADNMHVVGFSLGAHAVGAAARILQRAGLGKIGRLTALDPARPCFARGHTARRWRLAREDAAFVHVVHSSAGSLGLARPLGHVDVYLRGAGAGAGQGAAGLARAHHAAWRLWARSARAALSARSCADAASLRAGECLGAATSVGYSCSPDTRGIFLIHEKDLPVSD